MSLNVKVPTFLIFVVVLLTTVDIDEASAAKCNTSSGSECNVKCDAWTASATCQKESKICDCSCSSNNSSLAQNLTESMQRVSGGQFSRQQIEQFLLGNFNFQQRYRQGPQLLLFQGKEFIIDID